MLKFFLGLFAGIIGSVTYVYFNVQLPEFMQLPGLLKDNIVSSTTEEALYDLGGEATGRQRALEIYFASRPAEAAQLDADSGHPLMGALYAQRATREARQVSMMWSAFDVALEKPALRQALERRHGTTDTEALKLTMLLDAIGDRPFLKSWLEQAYGPVTADNVRARLAAASVEQR
jgi:hypothetical protein